VIAVGIVVLMFRSWKALLASSAVWLAGLVASLVARRWTGAVAAGVLLAAGLSAAGIRWWIDQPSRGSAANPVPGGKVPSADYQVDVHSQSAERPASITVVRQNGLGGVVRRFKVVLDGEVTTRLWSGRSVRLVLNPGEHQLRVFMSRGWGSDTVTVETAPGEEWMATIVTDDLRTAMAKRDGGELTWRNANAASPMRLDVSRAAADGA
jgi:hypothetical protein